MSLCGLLFLELLGYICDTDPKTGNPSRDLGVIHLCPLVFRSTRTSVSRGRGELVLFVLY